MVRIDVHAARDFLCHGLTVAGQHDNFIDAVTAHLIERLLHLRANRVLNADDADELFITGDVKKVLARQAGIEGFIILNPVFGEDNVLEQCVAFDSTEDIRLGLRIEVDDLCIAAALEVEDTIVIPAVLIIADQQTFRIRGQRRLKMSGAIRSIELKPQ